MKRILYCFFCISLACNFTLRAQNSDSVLQKAVKLIDNEQYYDAERCLKTAIDQGMDSLYLHYELAWCYYSMQDYEKSISTLESLLNRQDVVADVYQLLGNAFDEIGQSGKAVSIYEQGLDKFENAGCLYLELGNMKYKNGDYKNAIYYYEKGIEHDPMFASNYYRAALVFLSSTEEVWGVMYGELFMLLERDSERCKLLSRQLFETYFQEISFNRGVVSVDFNSPTIAYSNSSVRPNLFPDNFQDAMTNAAKSERHLDLASLNRIRHRFSREFNSNSSSFENVLSKYHDRLISAGHFEAYNYWLFGYGNPNQTAQWVKANKTKWDSFLAWFEKNPISINQNEVFSRYTME